MMKDFLSNLYFNPYLFALGLYFILEHPKKLKIALAFIIFIPFLFNYEIILGIIISLQVITVLFERKNYIWLKEILLYYLIALVEPAVGELFGGIVQGLSILIFRYSLNYWNLNIICLIPEALFCWLIWYLNERYYYQIKKAINEMSTNLKYFNALIWIIGSLTITDYILWMLAYDNTTLALFLMLASLIITGIVIFNLYEALRQNQNYLRVSVENAELQEVRHYTHQLEQANINLRKARHDYKNSLLSLNGYLADQNIEGAQHYLDTVINYTNHVQKVSQTLTLELANLKVNELKYLLIQKLQLAQEKEIHTKVEINKEISSFPCNIMGLIRCSGILLDNAIEACTNQSDPQISVLLTEYPNQAYSLTFTNTVTKPININNVLKIGRTSKKDHQGIGLANVNEIVNNDPCLSLAIEQEKNQISFELLIQAEE